MATVMGVLLGASEENRSTYINTAYGYGLIWLQLHTGHRTYVLTFTSSTATATGVCLYLPAYEFWLGLQAYYVYG